MYLQYKIELAQNGLVDGDSGASISERLERLRQYSRNFRHGVFDYEDLTSHPEYVLRMVDLKLDIATPISSQGSTSALYCGEYDSESKRRDYFFSVFIPGSALAGIPSSRCVLPYSALDEPARRIIKYAIDVSQDLLVTVEMAEHRVPRCTRLTEVYFYSLSSLNAARKTHPAAALPSLQVPQAGNGLITQVRIDQLSIFRDHVTLGLGLPHGPPGIHSIAVCNWKTGQVTKRLDFGKRAVHFVPLDGEHILVSPRRGLPSHIDIYNISGSPSTPCHPVRTLELPAQKLNERVSSFHWHLHTSEHATTPGGHFRVDPSSSIVVLTFVSVVTSAEDSSSTSYLLIPCTTLSAQIIRACAKPEHSQRPPDRSNPRGPSLQSDTIASSAPEPAPVTVPWSDWGPHGCLRLRAQRAPPRDYIPVVPFGSQMPLVAFEDPDFRRVSVYVFDVNHFSAHHARQVLAAHGSERESDSEFKSPRTATVEDVEAVLPGGVDPECSTIPYVAYRFELPYGPSEEPHGHAIQSVEMNMTGFTVKLDSEGSVRFEEAVQTWTV